MGFSQTVGMEALQINRCLLPATRQEARQDLFFKHTIQFAGNTGSEIKSRFANSHREAAGGADGVVDHFCPGGEQGLLAVVWRHDTATLAEAFLHPS